MLASDSLVGIIIASAKWYRYRLPIRLQKGTTMAEEEYTLVYAAAYESLDDAKEDFQGIKELHREKWMRQV